MTVDAALSRVSAIIEAKSPSYKALVSSGFKYFDDENPHDDDELGDRSFVMSVDTIEQSMMTAQVARWTMDLRVTIFYELTRSFGKLVTTMATDFTDLAVALRAQTDWQSATSSIICIGAKEGDTQFDSEFSYDDDHARAEMVFPVLFHG